MSDSDDEYARAATEPRNSGSSLPSILSINKHGPQRNVNSLFTQLNDDMGLDLEVCWCYQKTFSYHSMVLGRVLLISVRQANSGFPTLFVSSFLSSLISSYLLPHSFRQTMTPHNIQMLPFHR